MTNSTKFDPSIAEWKSQSFPDAAQALRKRAPRILERWLEEVKQELPLAEELTFSQLRDHVPLMLDQMASALASNQSEASETASQPHGELRFHQSYDVRELLVEYHLLRVIIVGEIAEELNRCLTTPEAIAINVVLDSVQRLGVVAFVEHLTGQLRASDDLQANYISYLNHDLRGGMNGILLMVEVLKRELASEPRFTETADDLEAMRRSVMDSVSTMDRFVFAHRLGRGKQQVRFGTVNLKPILNDTIHTLRHSAEERRVKLTVSVADDCVVETDRDLLRLIVQNVIGNSIRHSKREGGNVTVIGERKVSGCVITISDDGPGIDLKLQPDLFSPASTSSKNRAGFKLGLPVSKMAADAMGMKIGIESSPGEGTTVTLQIPDHAATANITTAAFGSPNSRT